MLKRLLAKFVMMLIFLAGIGSYFAYLNGHSPFAFATSWFNASESFGFGDMQSLDSAKITSEGENGTVMQAGTSEVFKWQDETGQWNYGQKPPSDANQVESMIIDPNVNLVAGVKVPGKKAPASKSESTSEEMPSLEDSLDNPYSPDSIKKLFEDAKGLQDTLNLRAEAQGKLTKPK